MSTSSIKRKLLPAKNAWKRLATMLRSNLFHLKRSKTLKRTATGLNTAVYTVLRRSHRRPPSRFRLKRRSSLARLPSTDTPPRTPTQLKQPRRRRRHQHIFSPVHVDELFFNIPTTPVHILQVAEPAASKAVVDKAAPGRGGPLKAAGADEGSPSSHGRVLIKADQPPVAVGELVAETDHTQPEKSSGPSNNQLLMRRDMEEAGPAAAASSTTSGSSVAQVGMEQLEGVDLRAELFIAKFKQEMRRQRQRSLEDYQQMLARGL